MKVDGVLPGNHILKGRSSLRLQGGSTKPSGQLQSLRGCSGRRTTGRLDGVLRATRLLNQLARPWLNPLIQLTTYAPDVLCRDSVDEE